MSDNPLSSKIAIDTTDFKTGISELNRDIRVIESGFRAAAAGMGDWDKTSAGLSTRIEALNGKIDLQKQKVSALEGEYKRVATAQGDGSKAAELLKIKLNNEYEALGKMQGELKTSQTALDGMGKESKTAAGKVDDLAGKEDKASNSTDRLKGLMHGLGSAVKVGVAAIAGMAAAVAGMAVGLGALVLKTAKTADDLDELSQKTGITTTRLQELQYIANLSGIDLETMTGSMAKLVRSMAAASTQSDKASTSLANMKLGDKAEQFDLLSISIHNSDGSFRAVKDVYKDVTDVLKTVENPVERNRIALTLFGVAADKVTTKNLPGLEKSMMTASAQLFDFQTKAESAAATLSPAAEAFKTLGVSITDSTGALRNNQDVFNEALIALGKIPGETERDALAMQIFGKSAQELNPLVEMGAAGMAKMADEAHKMGAVMSEENVKAAADLNDKIDSLKTGVQGIAMTLAGALVPGLSAAASGAQDLVKRLVDILAMMKTDPEGGKKLLTGLVSDIVSQIPQLLSAGMAIIQGLMTAIIGALPTLVKVAVQIITSFMTFLIQNLPLLINAGIEMIMSLVNGILPQLPQFTKLAMDMVLNLVDGIFSMLPELLTAAVQIIVTLVQGLADHLPRLMVMAAKFIPEIIITLVQTLPLLIGAAIQLILARVNGLKLAIPILIEYTPQIIQAIVEALIIALPLIFDAAVQIIVELTRGIVSMLPSLGASALKIMQAIDQGMRNLLPVFWDIGKSIVTGLWQGFLANWDVFRDSILNLVKSIGPSVQNVLQGHSPSMVFARIGADMVNGLGIGFASQFRGVQAQINGAIAGLGGMANMNVNVNGTFSSGGGARTQTVNHIYLGGIHVGNGDPQVVRQAAEQGVRSALRATGLA